MFLLLVLKTSLTVIMSVNGMEVKLLSVSLIVENHGLAKPSPLRLVISIGTSTDYQYTVLKLGIFIVKRVNGLLLYSSQPCEASF